jgi:hypothetical protein
MHWLYGYYHWKVVFAHPRWDIPDHIRDPVFAVFRIIGFHKVFFAIGATALAVVCMRHKPRWIGVAVLIPAVLMLFLACFLMT